MAHGQKKTPKPLCRLLLIVVGKQKMKLKKFLIELDRSDSGIHLVGVTAWSEDDALSLIHENIPKTNQLPDMRNIKEITSLDDLDQEHIIPNMQEFVTRGVWFPRGYSTRK